MMASAGLPKKNFRLLLDALDRLPGVDRRLVIGLTVGHEGIAQELGDLVATRPDPARTFRSTSSARRSTS